jgi:hypothetical protein
MPDEEYDNINIHAPIRVKTKFYKTLHRYMAEHPDAKVWEVLEQMVSALESRIETHFIP